MWYWIVMAVLVIGCIALLSGTFFSIKKNKAEEAAKRAEARKKKRKKPADAEEAQQPGERRKRADGGRQSSQGAENGRQQDAQARREEARRVQAEQRKERKTPPVESNPGRPGFVDKVQFYFYSNIGIGRAESGQGYERYLSLSEDGRVSKKHCVIVHRGDKLYLKDEGSRNGTYLNGEAVTRPVVLQKDDVIGLGGTRLEILNILRESE